jgi:hypothetical protein
MVLPHGQHEIGLVDRLLGPWRQRIVGQKQHEVVRLLERVQRMRDFGRRGIAGGRHHVGHDRGTHDGHARATAELGDQPLHERLRHRAAAGADQRDGARQRIRRRGPCDIARGYAPGEGSGERAPDAGLARGEVIEFGASEAEHDAVAQSGDGGRPRAAGQERDLADGLAGPQFGDGGRAFGNRHAEAARDGDEHGVGGRTLRHQHVAPLQVDHLEFGTQARAILGREVREHLHAIEGGRGQAERQRELRTGEAKVEHKRSPGALRTPPPACLRADAGLPQPRGDDLEPAGPGLLPGERAGPAAAPAQRRGASA